MAKRIISDEEHKKLLRLHENSKSGKDDDVDAFDNYIEELGIGPDEVQEYLAVKNGPETEQEKRLAKKGTNPTHNRTEGPILLEKIAEAYGVDLKEREKGVPLASFLNDNGVFSFVPGSTREKYLADQRNAFEQLGLNWDNLEDRKRLADSIAYYNQNDELDSNAKEFEESKSGTLLKYLMPRTFERGMADIRTGNESPLSKYLKDGIIDAGENVLMTVGSPASGVVRIVGKAANVAPKIGSKVAGKAARSAKAVASQTADAAFVPTLTELVDAAAYADETDNERSEFSGTDAAVGTAVNEVAPYIVGRKGGMLLRRIPGLGQNLANIAEGIGKTKVGKNIEAPLSAAWELNPGIDNLYVNKIGKSGMATSIPVVGELVQPREEEKEGIQEKKMKKEEKRKLWANGFAIPFPGDRDYEEYTKWKQENTRKVLGLGKYL